MSKEYITLNLTSNLYGKLTLPMFLVMDDVFDYSIVSKKIYISNILYNYAI